MCLIVFLWNPVSEPSLTLAANRDEFHARPTAAAHWWADAPIFAGRDLHANGTWMGVTRSGRFAAITNVRAPGSMREGTLSRGQLVTEFLMSTESPVSFLRDVATRATQFNGFNLLVGSLRDQGAMSRSLAYLDSRGLAPRELSAGLYGLSNDALDSPWPKVQVAKLALVGHLQAKRSETDRASALFTILSSRELAPDDRLPATGVSIERERMLSAACIVSPSYGTRASSVLVADSLGARFVERSRDSNGEEIGEVCESIAWSAYL